MFSQIKDHRRLYAGRVVTLDLDRVVLPHGREVTMEVVRHHGSVAFVPMPDPDHLILVRQYRYALDRFVWEIPAGVIDPGESAEEAVRRECHEEVGRLAGDLESLFTLYPTPGYCDERLDIFLVRDLAQPPEAAAVDEDESLEACTVSLRAALAMLERGEILDMKTAVALLALARRSSA